MPVFYLLGGIAFAAVFVVAEVRMRAQRWIDIWYFYTFLAGLSWHLITIASTAVAVIGAFIGEFGLDD